MTDTITDQDEFDRSEETLADRVRLRLKHLSPTHSDVDALKSMRDLHLTSALNLQVQIDLMERRKPPLRRGFSYWVKVQPHQDWSIAFYDGLWHRANGEKLAIEPAVIGRMVQKSDAA